MDRMPCFPGGTPDPDAALCRGHRPQGGTPDPGLAKMAATMGERL